MSPAKARALPESLPRVERVVEPDSIVCPCGCGDMVKIGEDRSERLDYIPARYQVIVTVRPRYACPKGRTGVVQAKAPAHLLEGSWPTEALLAQIALSKHSEHMPLNRQAVVMARHGVPIDRSVLADWMGRTGALIAPIVDHMAKQLLAGSTRLYVDETSELRVRKPRTGEHGCATAEDALAMMRSMAGRWSDEHIAASLNRMGLPTGQGKTWTAHRVASVRRVRGIHACRSAEKDGEWRKMTEAAKASGVANHLIRHLVRTGILSAVQVVSGAPYQIRADDLASEAVRAAVARKGRPCRAADTGTLPMFTDT